MGPHFTHQPSGTELLNISVAVPTELTGLLILASAEAAGKSGLFTLGRTSNVPHLTLFMTRFPADARAHVVEAVQTVAQRKIAPTLNHIGYNSTDGGYFEALYQSTTKLRNLQTELAVALQPLTTRISHTYRESYYGPFTQSQQTSVRLYGYDLMGELFRPHVTLTRFPEKADTTDLASRMPAPGRLSFRATSLQVAVADTNGSAIAIVTRVSLPAQTPPRAE